MRPQASSVLYRCLDPRPLAASRLVCFPYAGASVYRLWPAGLTETVEVLAAQLPGREGRLARSRPETGRDW
jgi:surfactin synthase thioesterase subunit